MKFIVDAQTQTLIVIDVAYGICVLMSQVQPLSPSKSRCRSSFNLPGREF